MSSSDIAISVRGLSKSYSIAHNVQRATTMAEALMRKLRHPFRPAEVETFWALKDVNFDVKKGEVVGIIGRNGAGKSTLLKVLSRITEPTTGEIDLYGRVGSLLEVGTGFHPELTGRENIYLNGGILGMSRGEIKKQFDAIVDFAEVEKFLDTPVKRYSSGMYVRLAFAVAAHLNPEILIVDEVLAVGDAQFQAKCLGKMKDVAGHGRTVLFVSHNMSAVETLCSRCVLMVKGRTEFIGSTSEALETYTALGISGEHGIYRREGIASEQKGVLLEELRIESDDGYRAEGYPFGTPLTFDLRIAVREPLRDLSFGLGINNSHGHRCATLHSKLDSIPSPDLSVGECRVRCRTSRLSLKPGHYSLKVSLESGSHSLAQLEQIAPFVITEARWPIGAPLGILGDMVANGEWRITESVYEPKKTA